LPSDDITHTEDAAFGMEKTLSADLVEQNVEFYLRETWLVQAYQHPKTKKILISTTVVPTIRHAVA